MTKVTPPKAPGTLSALYVDGILLQDLDALYQVNTRLLGGQRWDDPNQFWASPARAGDSPIREVLEIALSDAKWVNHFSFQVSHFPARMWLQYFDAKAKKWQAVKQRKNGKQVEVTITDSVPARISEHPASKVHRHPQHSAPGHWQFVNLKTKRVKASRFRIVLVRVPSVAAPVKITKHEKADYSLAIKEFQCGFEALSRDDVPKGKPTGQNVGKSTPFSTSVDLLGSTVQFSITEYKAADLLWPALQAQAGVPADQRDGDAEVWKCEPQPVPNAVVNLYADARSKYGHAQTVDRFYIDPTTSGVSCNLYYSNDDPDPLLGFAASDQPLRYPTTQPHGSISSDDDGVLFSDAGPTPAYLDIDNAALQVNTNAPWWLGLHIEPNFSATSTRDRVILDSPWLSIRWDGTQRGFVFTTEGTSYFRAGAEDPFVAGQQVAFAISSDGRGTWRLAMPGWAGDVPLTLRGSNVSDAALAAFPEYAHSFRLGGAMTDATHNPGFGGYLLKGAVIKQEQSDPASEAEFFAVDPDVYLVEANLSEDDREYMRNSLLRIHPFFRTEGATSRNPMGAVGGPGVGYDTLTWTPINRDYRLARGYLEFDPVSAKYFKFEFTNLSPQPFDSIEPISRVVRLFTSATIKESRQQRGSAGGASPDSGAKANQVLGDQTYFSDQNRLNTVTDPNRSYTGYTPTEAYHSTDPVTAARLAELNPAFRLQQWHRPPSAPRFTKVSQHFYEMVRIEHSDKIAYSVGLSQLRMFRTSQAGADDAGLYRYLFYDADGIDGLTGWTVLDRESTTLPGGGLRSSSDSTAAVATSVPLLSRRNVRGVQFATTQSDARQMLTDADFTDVTLPTWASVGGAQIAPSADLNSTLGSTVRVDRSVQGTFWRYLELRFPTWASAVKTTITSSTGAALVEDPDDPGTFIITDPTDVYEDPDDPGTEVLLADSMVTEDSTDPGTFLINAGAGGSGSATTVTSALSWADVSDSDAGGNSYGGLQSTEFVQPVETGRLYGAARVYCPTALESPLRVQIVTADGEVLADEQVTPRPGGITEWFCSYQIEAATLQDLPDGSAISWGGIEALDPDPMLPTFRDLTIAYGTWWGLQNATVPAGAPAAPPPTPVRSRSWSAVEAVGAWSAVESLGTWSQVQAASGNIAFLSLSASLAVPNGLTGTPPPGTGRHRYADIEAASPDPHAPTYADLGVWGSWATVQGGSLNRASYTGPVSVRVIQDTPTLDTWYMDNISLFEDSILWEFSNDGGQTWYPAYDIRNDPRGVLLFPTVGGEGLDAEEDTALLWRLTTHRPDQHVSALWVRPWYATLPLGVPHREGLNSGGPNQSAYDHYPAIEDSAPFKAWHKPVPRDWFFIERQWLLGDTASDSIEFTDATTGSPADPTGSTPPTYVLPATLVHID